MSPPDLRAAPDRLPAAVFLDRDGTLIEERELVRSPEQIVLLPGVADAIRALRAAGYRIVVVTNQSGIARGTLAPEQLAAVHRALAARLEALGAPVDAIYFSPDGPDPEAERDRPFARRKPGAGMLLEAAADLGLALERSWMIGDQPRDAVAGRRAGCRGSLLVGSGRAPLPADALELADGVFADLAAAVDWLLDQTEVEAPGARATSALRRGLDAE